MEEPGWRTAPALLPFQRGRKIDSTLIAVMLATLLAGSFSICTAAVVSRALAPGMAERMVSLSAGLMLATSLLNNLPEAFESGADARNLLATILGGIFAFFLIEKSSLLRQRHVHRADRASGTTMMAHRHGGPGAGWMVVIGDGMHNFSDGILIAAAFLANPKIGLVTGLAIVAHEIPQRIGDFLLLRNHGYSTARAVRMNLPSMLMAVAGGMAGYLALDHASSLIPYVLACSSAGFLYIALSNLVPRMRREATWSETVPQLLLIALGVGIVLCLTDSHVKI